MKSVWVTWAMRSNELQLFLLLGSHFLQRAVLSDDEKDFTICMSSILFKSKHVHHCLLLNIN